MEQLMQLWRPIGAAWAFELFSLDGQPMTIGKLITGIILLVVGYRLSKRASDVIDERFLTRLDVDVSMRFSLRRVLFYFFLVIVTLTVLRALSVPITIFTVIGGALAIGFGFGSQNVVSNFISGIILMVERPVRVGDVISVDGQEGTVQLIGIRATHLLTLENKNVIVPNSFFLEKAVINSTLEDDIVRSDLTIGVSYEANPVKVRDLLNEAWKSQPLILRQPEPKVIFQDFGDNALIFTLQYWTKMTGEKPKIEIGSDLRFKVSEIFTREKMEIPYPQRDLHIDFTKPIPIEWQPPRA